MSQALLPPKKRKENHPPQTNLTSTTLLPLPPLPPNNDNEQLRPAPFTKEPTEETSPYPALAASPPRLRVKSEPGMKWEEDDITERGRGEAGELQGSLEVDSLLYD